MIELATSAMLLFSFLYGVAGANVVPQTSKIEDSPKSYLEITIVDDKALSAPVGGKVSIENEVRNYFKDTPILAEIAKCESRFRQLNEAGEVLTGKVNKADIGVMQINTDYHLEVAEYTGIDLNTLHGNMEYAKILYDKYGTSPWKASSRCWQKYEQIAKK